MHDKPQDKPQIASPSPIVHPLKELSAEQFAALGMRSVAYMRLLDANQLSILMPGTGINPDAGLLHMLFSADGSPVLVTDNETALEDWLEEHSVSLAVVH